MRRKVFHMLGRVMNKSVFPRHMYTYIGFAEQFIYIILAGKNRLIAEGTSPVYSFVHDIRRNDFMSVVGKMLHNVPSDISRRSGYKYFHRLLNLKPLSFKVSRFLSFSLRITSSISPSCQSTPISGSFHSMPPSSVGS